MITRIHLALAVALLASACDRTETRPPSAPSAVNPRKPLSAEERQGVQLLGRAVLEARGHAREDADIAALNQELRALREDLKKAASPVPGTIVLENRSQKPAPGVRAAEEPGALLTRRLDSLRAKRVRLSSRAGGGGDPELSGRLAALAGAAEVIEREAREALALSGTERLARLIKLEEKLGNRPVQDPGRRAQASALAPEPDRTPTITTITSHR